MKNRKFWSWKNQTGGEPSEERTLELYGTIAEERWFDDDVTPAMFRAELFAGSKEDCATIKAELKGYLADVLKLELSDEKTKITHSSENARFLGYDVSVRRSQELKRRSDGVKQRALNGTVMRNAPLKDKIEEFLISVSKRNEIRNRVQSGICELCGYDNVPVVVHHVKSLKSLKGKSAWEQKMLSIRRKTLIVCEACHNKMHNRTFC